MNLASSVALCALLCPVALAMSGVHGPTPALLADSQGDCGEPLMLSPLISAGKLDEARQKSRVDLKGVKSHSGFVTVNETTNSNLFFWFFPGPRQTEAPLLMWLQGGPGASSLVGLFGEMGMYRVNEDIDLDINEFSWNHKYSMLFVDNPAGTGFSFTDKPVLNQDGVAEHMIEFLQQFFTLFHEYRHTEFYVAGESYGGKYAPTVSSAIHYYNKGTSPSTSKLPLTGVIMADGWCDPETHMPAYAPMLYNMGIMDQNQARIVEEHMQQAEKLRAAGQRSEAFDYWNQVWADYTLPVPSLFVNYTGSTNTMNSAQSAVPEGIGRFSKWLSKCENRKAMHVGKLPFGGEDIYGQMVRSGDFMDTIKPKMPVLLENYRVLIYNGNYDAIVGAPVSEPFIASINWSGQKEYNGLMSSVWKVRPEDPDVAGYARELGQHFARVIVRNGGHLLPFDQPRTSQDMIYRFVDRRGFGESATIETERQ